MRALTAYNLLALLACGALAAWAYREAQQPLASLPEATAVIPVVEAAMGPAVAPAPGPAFRMPPKNAFAQLVTRPPFSPSRRPPRARPVAPPVVAKSPQEAPAPVAEPQVTLVGIVISPDRSIAMVRKPGADELLRLAKGESLDGWLVESVLPDRLLLSLGETVLELELTEAAQAKGATGRAAGVAARPRRP